MCSRGLLSALATHYLYWPLMWVLRIYGLESPYHSLLCSVCRLCQRLLWVTEPQIPGKSRHTPRKTFLLLPSRLLRSADRKCCKLGAVNIDSITHSYLSLSASLVVVFSYISSVWLLCFFPLPSLWAPQALAISRLYVKTEGLFKYLNPLQLEDQLSWRLASLSTGLYWTAVSILLVVYRYCRWT